jgi:hypothetical protein
MKPRGFFNVAAAGCVSKPSPAFHDVFHLFAIRLKPQVEIVITPK